MEFSQGRPRQRKSADRSKRLNRGQSGRPWKFAEALTRATDILGSQKRAEDWLVGPAMALDIRTPLELGADDARRRPDEQRTAHRFYPMAAASPSPDQGRGCVSSEPPPTAGSPRSAVFGWILPPYDVGPGVFRPIGGRPRGRPAFAIELSAPLRRRVVRFPETDRSVAGSARPRSPAAVRRGLSTCGE